MLVDLNPNRDIILSKKQTSPTVPASLPTALLFDSCTATRKALMQSIKDAGKVCMVQEEKTNMKADTDVSSTEERKSVNNM